MRKGHQWVFELCFVLCNPAIAFLIVLTVKLTKAGQLDPDSSGSWTERFWDAMSSQEGALLLGYSLFFALFSIPATCYYIAGFRRTAAVVRRRSTTPRIPQESPAPSLRQVCRDVVSDARRCCFLLRCNVRFALRMHLQSIDTGLEDALVCIVFAHMGLAMGRGQDQFPVLATGALYTVGLCSVAKVGSFSSHFICGPLVGGEAPSPSSRSRTAFLLLGFLGRAAVIGLPLSTHFSKPIEIPIQFLSSFCMAFLAGLSRVGMDRYTPLLPESDEDEIGAVVSAYMAIIDALVICVLALIFGEWSLRLALVATAALHLLHGFFVLVTAGKSFLSFEDLDDDSFAESGGFGDALDRVQNMSPGSTQEPHFFSEASTQLARPSMGKTESGVAA
mmetsp:Transcript_8867/g.19868  ORF Transcript_8867/g.19868 Transcript_8867/m.19868 type:complete len:390 (+) Transcript_8867:2-1171(+)